MEHFFKQGWCRFPYDSRLAEWVEKTLPAAREVIQSSATSNWWRCGGTWFAGVNALPNDATGAVADGMPLAGDAVEFVRTTLGLQSFEWDCAQVSVCYPGYPQPMVSESDAAFRYRRDRDAAHVDGLLPKGPRRRRHLREHHAFVLGIPMVESPRGASPFVIWQGSHEIMRNCFAECFTGLQPESWGEVDVTKPYHAARKKVFAECPRVELSARPGEAYIAHRLSLHGTARWSAKEAPSRDGRMICYFRPAVFDPEHWLTAA